MTDGFSDVGPEPSAHSNAPPIISQVLTILPHGRGGVMSDMFTSRGIHPEPGKWLSNGSRSSG